MLRERTFDNSSLACSRLRCPVSFFHGPELGFVSAPCIVRHRAVATSQGLDVIVKSVA
jgi:hypothetical protein